MMKSLQWFDDDLRNKKAHFIEEEGRNSSLLIFKHYASGIGTGPHGLLPRLQRASPSTSLDKNHLNLI
jgi:hypothetical protein